MGHLPDGPIILYDGVCGLCHRLHRFALAGAGSCLDDSASPRCRAPRRGRSWRVTAGTRSTSTPSIWCWATAAPTSACSGNPTPALWILRELGGAWRAAAMLRVLPRWLRDPGYDLVARTRYRLFGRYDACPLPDPRHRGRFLDLSG